MTGSTLDGSKNTTTLVLTTLRWNGIELVFQALLICFLGIQDHLQLVIGFYLILPFKELSNSTPNSLHSQTHSISATHRRRQTRLSVLGRRQFIRCSSFDRCKCVNGDILSMCLRHSKLTKMKIGRTMMELLTLFL